MMRSVGFFVSVGRKVVLFDRWRRFLFEEV